MELQIIFALHADSLSYLKITLPPFLGFPL